MLIDSMLPLRMLGFLMLMFSLCDATSRCPIELILDPPEILSEYYGESVTVNCASGGNNHVGMYWKVGDTDSPVEYGNNVSQSVPLLDWNVTAECKIKLNDTYECSKDLNITLYKNPVIVNLFPTKHGAMVEGTQYELQCDIVDVAPVQHLTVRWYRDDVNGIIKTDYSTQPTTTNILGSESFTLAANFSRRENGAQFRCEAQLDFGQHGSPPPVTSDVYTVSLHYAPELKNKTEDVYVNEGDYVTLNCEADGHPAPAIHWSRDGVNLTETTNNLNITLATNAIYNCTATNNLGNATKQIQVHVKQTNITGFPAAVTTPAPSTPRSCSVVITPPEIVVRFGDPASVNCSTSATDFSIIGWEATSGGRMSGDNVIAWTVEKVEDWDAKPICYTTDVNNEQCFKVLDITLYKTPDNVSVSALDQGPMVEGTAYRLKCDITNVAPVQKLKVTWYRGNETVLTEMFNDTSKFPVNVSSTLRVLPERDHNGLHFRCEAELHIGLNGAEHVPTVTSPPYPMAVVHYKPLFKNCPVSYAGAENEFSIGRLSCEVDGNPPPTIQWSYKEELINASEPLTRDQSGEYTAKIANSLGSSNFSVLITVEYGPSFTCAARHEVKENGTFQCEADGIPKPLVTWFKEEKESRKEVAAPQRWTKNDHGNYSLQATNKHGNDTLKLHVVVLYAPVFKGGYSKEVDVILGENVTFDCSADGQPLPEIKWSYSSGVKVTEATKGRQSISVTRATSTDAGAYICDATNKVGVVKRTVTLVVKDRPKQRAMTAMWWLLIVLVIVLILILIFFVHRWKKQGQYSFVPGQANDNGSAIPMIPQSNGVKV